MKKRITITDIYKNVVDRKIKTSESYERIYDILIKRIQKKSHENKSNYIYEIPEYLYGYPLFSLDICIHFLYGELTNNGFLVKYYFPKFLYISWDFDEIKFENDKKNLPYPVPVYKRPELPYYQQPIALPLYDPNNKYNKSAEEITKTLKPKKEIDKITNYNVVNDNSNSKDKSNSNKHILSYLSNKNDNCINMKSSGKYSLNFN